MEKKIAEISESFQHLRFAECLAMIDQALKKSAKTDKKKQQISASEMRLIKIFKIGCLVSLGQYHQAHAIFQQITDPQSIQILGKDNHIFITLSIAELFGQNRQKAVLELFDKYCPNHKKIQLYRFYLSTGLYAPLGKLFLKDFVTTKQISLQLAQIYLQYLQNLQKFNMIEYGRDQQYKYNQNLKLNLKLVSMFTDKCIKTAEEQLEKLQREFKEKESTFTTAQASQGKSNIEITQKTITKANQLKLKIAIHQGRVKQAIFLYENLRGSLKFPFDFLRSILKLAQVSEQKQQLYSFYIFQISKIFIKNLKLKDFSPWYDHYNQFFQFILLQASKQDPSFKSSIKLQEKNLQVEKLYIFKGLDFKEIILGYYWSILNQFRNLVDVKHTDYEQNKKSDYYKICLKGLLLQLIQIASFFNQETLLVKYLSQYTKYFSATLTFANQIKAHKCILIKNNVLKKPEEVCNDSQLIQEINYHKIYMYVQGQSFIFSSFQAILKDLGQLYTIRVKEVEKNKHLEKGERYLSDQFFTIISDYARAYIEQQASQPVINKTVTIMINQLEYIVEVSPYNADTKLRLMYFCSLLNHHERLIEVYLSNDIKSVQMETLGYWFLKTSIEFGLVSNYEHFTDRFVKSYHQNQRQTSEYGLKALKGGQLDRVSQYVCYRNNMLSSYNSVVLFYLLYQKNRFQNGSQYYLIKINQKINQFARNQRKFTFNADSKVLANQIYEDYHFADFYGLFNNYKILQTQVNVCLHQFNLVNLLLERNIELPAGLIELKNLQEEIKHFQVKSLFDFNSYTFQQRRVKLNLQKSRHTLLRYSNYLENFKNVALVRVNILFLISEIVNYLKNQQLASEIADKIVKDTLNLLAELRNFHLSLDYRHQIWSINLIRKSLYQSINLINVLRQTVSKTKKIKFAKQIVEKLSSPLFDEIFNTIVELKWQTSNIQVQSRLVLSRDQALERQLSIDSKEVKRILSKFQNMYK